MAAYSAWQPADEDPSDNRLYGWSESATGGAAGKVRALRTPRPAEPYRATRIRTFTSTVHTIPPAARELAAFLAETLRGRKLIIIFGALRDKAVDEIAGIFFPHAGEVIFTQPNTSRSISASQLAEIAGHHAASYKIIPDAEKALESAMAQAASDDVICITGSLYLVGELRHHW